MKTPVIYTYTGREVNPLDLKVDDIEIRDIAHALALCNRFAGHTRQPISVAQHSFYVCAILVASGMKERSVLLQALLHDASEAYLGDVTKWLKATVAMNGYREAEARAQATIYEAFGLPTEEHHSIKWADTVMVRHEGVMGFGNSFIIRGPNGERHADYPDLSEEERRMIGRWEFLPWSSAEQGFLEAYDQISNGGELAWP